MHRTNSLILSKADQATCRYFTMPGGCVRGEKCLFTHSEETLSHAEFMSLAGMGQSFAPKQVGGSKVCTYSISPQRNFVPRTVSDHAKNQQAESEDNN